MAEECVPAWAESLRNDMVDLKGRLGMCDDQEEESNHQSEVLYNNQKQQNFNRNKQNFNRYNPVSITFPTKELLQNRRCLEEDDLRPSTVLTAEEMDTRATSAPEMTTPPTSPPLPAPSVLGQS